MMVHDTTYNGVLIERVVDNGDGTGTRTTWAEDGTMLTTEALTGLEIVPAFPPLDDAGALATLLAVNGVITVQEAANVEHVPVEHIIHEALAWSL